MDTDVLIVGAGPTGLMLANQLHRRGVRAPIIDQNAGPSLQTRALGVQARTLEIYAHLGIAERAIELGKRGTGANMWAKGRRKAWVPFSDIGRDLSPCSRSPGIPIAFLNLRSTGRRCAQSTKAHPRNLSSPGGRPMSRRVKSIPDTYAAPTPYLVVSNAAAAIDFYKRAFGAKEVLRMPRPDGKIAHADLAVGGGHLMLADEAQDKGHHSPRSLGGSPVGLVLYVDNVDSVVRQAVAAGASLTYPVADQFYGDRTGGLTDPFGHNWHVMTHIEDVSNEEMARRAASQFQAVQA